MRNAYYLLLFLFGGFASSLLHAGAIRAAATHPFIAEWILAVGGEHVDSVVLLDENKANTDSNTDIVFAQGLGQEPWLGAGDAEVYYLSDGLPLMRSGESYWADMPPPHPDPDKLMPCCQENARKANAEWSALVEQFPAKAPDASADLDPNLWFDVSKAMTAVVAINEILAENDPENAKDYDANAKRYLEQLRELNEDIQSRIGKIPAKQRVLVTRNGQFRYFAKAFGLIAPQGDYEAGVIFQEETDMDGLPCKCQIDGSPCTCKPGNCQCATLVLFTRKAPANNQSGNYDALMRYNTKLIARGLQTFED